MKITGINHITINVLDLPKSREFYETVFELEPADFVDMGDHHLTYYALPGNVRLELIEYVSPLEDMNVSELQTGTYRHLCLETDDLEELAGRCRKWGNTLTREPSFEPKLNFRNILLKDPNGVEIEVIQA